MRFYAPIAKVDTQERMVWGYASTEAEDDQGEVITRDALAEALADYLKFANIREMHQMSAVGIAEEASVDGKGLYVGARIVDPPAWEKVREGVYKGFSIGGRVKSRDPADRNIITALSLTEISLVDRPANPEAIFDCWKAEGGSVRIAEPAVANRQPVQIWHCGVAGHRHLAKAEAVGCLERGAGDNEFDDTADDVDHADPGYQADGKQRYPLDRESHIRAAWAFIHMPANADRYTPAEIDQIKSRIVAAWRERIDPAGPPAADDGDKAARMEFTKIGATHSRADQEALDHLHDCLKTLTDGDCCAKAGARHSKETLAQLKVAHDSLCRAGARCDRFDPAAEDADAGADKAARTGDLMKALAGEIVPRLDALTRRVEEIAATPLPPLTLARGFAGFSKREDGGGAAPSPDDIVAALARMSEDERTLALIKAAHANPIRPNGLGGR